MDPEHSMKCCVPLCTAVVLLQIRPVSDQHEMLFAHSSLSKA